MTDPRIIECAKALAKVRGIDPDSPLSDKSNTGGMPRTDIYPSGYVKFIPDARACILKWLEQPATTAMITRADEEKFIFDPRHAPPLDEVYTVMNAQARKEISSG